MPASNRSRHVTSRKRKSKVVKNQAVQDQFQNLTQKVRINPRIKTCKCASNLM